MPGTPNDLEAVPRAVEAHLPGRAVAAVRDLGTWVRQIYQVDLEDGERVFLKASINDAWLDGSRVEGHVTEILTRHGLPAPVVLVVDTSLSLLPYPFVIQQAGAGQRLDRLLAGASEQEAAAMYTAMGAFYRRLHGIRGPRSGVWTDDPREPWGNPVRYMFQNELLEGSARRALRNGQVSRRVYTRTIDLWQANLEYLEAHTSVLVHGSPFLWTIYLVNAGAAWYVGRLGALGDFLWWDAAYDLAFLRYPPFGNVSETRWRAFTEAYGPLPEDRRILLYLLLQRFCAVGGVYKAPAEHQSSRWRNLALASLDALLDAIEADSNGELSHAGFL